MIGRRAVIGLSLLSVLVFCAFAAPSAFATKGTTAFTCAPVTEKAQFKDAHCTEAGSGAGFRHEEIASGKETKITVTNEKTANKTTEHTPAVLSATLFGQASTVTCTNVHGEGFLQNNAGPPMNITGTVTIIFTSCTAKVGASENCKVTSAAGAGNIETKATVSSPTETDELKFVEDGAAFAKFEVVCPVLGTVVVTVTGSATGIPKGATLEFTKASTEKKGVCSAKEGLCANSNTASFTSVSTVTMEGVETGKPENPISVTTTES